MRRYIEIENKIIDILSVEYIYLRDIIGKKCTALVFRSGDTFTVDECYYYKLKELMNPITLKEA